MKFLVPASLLLVLGAGTLVLAGEAKPRERPAGLEDRIGRIEQRVEDLFQLALKLSAREDAAPSAAPEAGELARLKKEVSDLRRENEGLRKKVEGLERRAAAAEQSPQAPPAATPPLSNAPRIEALPMPDGKVLRADPDRGIVFIDLGSEDGVREEQRFKVFAVLRGGLRKEKGEIRVNRVEKDFSRCAVVSSVEGAGPIAAGDCVWNQLFVKGRRLQFVFVGRFAGENARFTKAQLARLLLDAGHDVSETVLPETHYVVLGEGFREDPLFRLAAEYRIEPLKPADLLELLGYPTAEGNEDKK